MKTCERLENGVASGVASALEIGRKTEGEILSISHLKNKISYNLELAVLDAGTPSFEIYPFNMPTGSFISIDSSNVIIAKVTSGFSPSGAVNPGQVFTCRVSLIGGVMEEAKIGDVVQLEPILIVSKNDGSYE